MYVLPVQEGRCWAWRMGEPRVRPRGWGFPHPRGRRRLFRRAQDQQPEIVVGRLVIPLRTRLGVLPGSVTGIQPLGAQAFPEDAMIQYHPWRATHKDGGAVPR